MRNPLRGAFDSLDGGAGFVEVEATDEFDFVDALGIDDSWREMFFRRGFVGGSCGASVFVRVRYC